MMLEKCPTQNLKCPTHLTQMPNAKIRKPNAKYTIRFRLKKSSLLITTITNQEDEKEKKKEGKNKRAFERFVDKAMEDGYRIKLLHPKGKRHTTKS
ncbi:MAG: hypothetical protein LBU44_03595 [Mediterranea sp.]|nr:hypothetical protein [Mediterranea sp.]